MKFDINSWFVLKNTNNFELHSFGNTKRHCFSHTRLHGFQIEMSTLFFAFERQEFNVFRRVHARDAILSSLSALHNPPPGSEHNKRVQNTRYRAIVPDSCDLPYECTRARLRARDVKLFTCLPSELIPCAYETVVWWSNIITFSGRSGPPSSTRPPVVFDFQIFCPAKTDFLPTFARP